MKRFMLALSLTFYLVSFSNVAFAGIVVPQQPVKQKTAAPLLVPAFLWVGRVILVNARGQQIRGQLIARGGTKVVEVSFKGKALSAEALGKAGFNVQQAPKKMSDAAHIAVKIYTQGYSKFPGK